MKHYNKYRPEANSNVYKDWRRRVYKRDRGRCQMPRCKRRGRLQVHHIRPWANNPHLRYEVANGICLCWNCHKDVTGKELHYERLFSQIVQHNAK